MGPPPQEAACQIEKLILAIEDLQRRVEALEHPPVARAETGPVLELPALAVVPGDLSSGLLASLGRVLLGLAGAYLLRAITEAGLVPHVAGTLLGVLYACVWLIVAQRAGVSNRWAAPLHGAAASAVLGPLLWEATVRFHTIAPPAAAAVLAVFIVSAQGLAWRSHLSQLADVVAVAGSATSIALIMATLNPLPFTIALVAAAVVAEYGASRDRGLVTRWIIALPAGFCVFLLAYLITRPGGLPEGYTPVPASAVVALLWVLLGTYLASTLFRTLGRSQRIAWFEIGQVAVLAALGIGTTLRLWPTAGMAATLGSACLLFTAGFYAAAGLRRIRKPERNARAFAAFGLLLALTGLWLLARGLTLAALWCTLALAATALGQRWRRDMLSLHGAFYLAAAAAVSGLMTWPPPAASSFLLGIAAALAYGLTLAMRPRAPVPWPDRVPSLISAALLCWSLLALATGSTALAGVLRTIVISAIAILLAWLGSRYGLTELLWLLYPWMTFGAAKLLLEDFGKGRSATLFVSLLVYGAILIALPRLLRFDKSKASEPSREGGSFAANHNVTKRNASAEW